MLNVPFCLIEQPWLEGTSTGASFDLLRHRKRARKVTVRIPQRKVTKFKLKIAPSFQFFLRNPAQKLLQCLSTPSKFYKCVEKDLGMRTGKIEILEDYFSKRLTLEAIYQSFWINRKILIFSYTIILILTLVIYGLAFRENHSYNLHALKCVWKIIPAICTPQFTVYFAFIQLR